MEKAATGLTFATGVGIMVKIRAPSSSLPVGLFPNIKKYFSLFRDYCYCYGTELFSIRKVGNLELHRPGLTEMRVEIKGKWQRLQCGVAPIDQRTFVLYNECI